jgi:hypothetical protein
VRLENVFCVEKCKINLRSVKIKLLLENVDQSKTFCTVKLRENKTEKCLPCLNQYFTILRTVTAASTPSKCFVSYLCRIRKLKRYVLKHFAAVANGFGSMCNR